MTIYVTAYDPTNKQCLAPSEPTHYATLAQVADDMGEPEHAYKRCMLYPTLGVAYSDFKFMKEDNQ